MPTTDSEMYLEPLALAVPKRAYGDGCAGDIPGFTPIDRLE